MTEQLKEAIERLKKHNEWRRGADIDMCEPKQLGKDIETLIQYASECQDLREENANNKFMREEYFKQNETLRREIAGYREALEYQSHTQKKQAELIQERHFRGQVNADTIAHNLKLNAAHADKALKTNDGQGGEL